MLERFRKQMLTPLTADELTVGRSIMNDVLSGENKAGSSWLAGGRTKYEADLLLADMALIEEINSQNTKKMTFNVRGRREHLMLSRAAGQAIRHVDIAGSIDSDSPEARAALSERLNIMKGLKRAVSSR